MSKHDAFISALLGGRNPEPVKEPTEQPPNLEPSPEPGPEPSPQLPMDRNPEPEPNPEHGPQADPLFTVRIEAAKSVGLKPEAATLIQGDYATAIFANAERVARLIGTPNRPEGTEATLLARAALANARKVHEVLPERQVGNYPYDPERERELEGDR